MRCRLVTTRIPDSQATEIVEDNDADSIVKYEDRKKRKISALDRTRKKSKKKKNTFQTVIFDKGYDEANATEKSFHKKDIKWRTIIQTVTCLTN